jgi:acyl CoA:acetate/3-ketoacid CoA transferase alpha subunit
MYTMDDVTPIAKKHAYSPTGAVVIELTSNRRDISKEKVSMVILTPRNFVTMGAIPPDTILIQRWFVSIVVVPWWGI